MASPFNPFERHKFTYLFDFTRTRPPNVVIMGVRENESMESAKPARVQRSARGETARVSDAHGNAPSRARHSNA
ncbi:hypothetical protein [Pararobbsia silviterrae]|uniref:hypothetical protein n=1 Tax=Pararobbsia silviterrae TaxID=1792498 RepID=UPI0011C36C3F|nr:hypothetical protein [Pararobbsia silviterrae]